jgi:hypothetical protein
VQVGKLLAQHLFESVSFHNQGHLGAKGGNITGEKQVKKFRPIIMQWRVLLHAVNPRHGANSYASTPKELRTVDSRSVGLFTHQYGT